MDPGTKGAPQETTNLARPLYMQDSAQDPDEESGSYAPHSGPGISWDDRVLESGGPLTARYRKVAQMLHHGHNSAAIAAAVGYSETRIEELASHPGILAELDRLSDKAHALDPGQRIKDMGEDAANILEDFLRDPDVPKQKKLDHARWVLEKIDGKAAQQLDVTGEVSIGVFLDKLDQIAKRPGQVLDITPKELPQDTAAPGSKAGANEPETTTKKDKLQEWLDSNLD